MAAARARAGTGMDGGGHGRGSSSLLMGRDRCSEPLRDPWVSRGVTLSFKSRLSPILNLVCADGQHWGAPGNTACDPAAAADPGATLSPYKPKCHLGGTAAPGRGCFITSKASEAGKETICPEEPSQLLGALVGCQEQH